jgi:hypothetical protein
MELSTFLYRLQTKKSCLAGILVLLLLQLMLLLPAKPVEAEVKQGFTWINSWTRDLYHYGKPVLTQCYSLPQVVNVGAGFVEYYIERLKGNEYWVDCPTSSFRVKTVNTEVWAVNRSEQVLSKCIWQLWALNDSEWLEVEDLESQLVLRQEQTQASLEYGRLMEDSSTFNVTWTFGNLAKARVTFKAGQERPYAVTWHVESPRATTETEHDMALELYEEDTWLCLLNYFDAGMFHNKTQLSALGQTGRKVRVTFVNKTFLAGETVTIDPTVDTFYSESARDGYIYKYGASYPPNSTSVSTSRTHAMIGQKKAVVNYYQYRAFFSFNTSALQDNASLSSCFLKLKLRYDYSFTDFDVKVYSGYYGTNLGTDDWDNCTTFEGVLIHTYGAQTKKWYQEDIAISSVNKTGLTQFKLTSSREEAGETPTDREDQSWYSGESEDEPELIVYYEQEEEDEETKGTGSTGGGDTFFEQVQQIGTTIKSELAKKGLYLLMGSLAVIAVGGVYAGTKSKRVSRKARGKTGGERSVSPRGHTGGRSAQPRGVPKKRRRDPRGRFA